MIVVKLEARPMPMTVLNFDLFTVYFRWDTLTAIQDRMDSFYENLEVSNESEEKANKVRDIIEGIIEEVVSKDYEETVIISASENVRIAHCATDYIQRGPVPGGRPKEDPGLQHSPPVQRAQPDHVVWSTLLR